MRHQKLMLALVLLLASSVTAQKPVCIVTTTVNTAKSAFTFGGLVSSPTSGPLSPGAPAPLSGSIYVVLPTGADGKCPAAAGLAKALDKAYIANPPGKPGITVGTVTASISIASITVDQIAFTVAATIADNTTKALDLTLEAISGNVNVNAGFFGSGASSLAGNVFKGTGCTLGSTAGGDITITCPSASLNSRLLSTVSGQNVDAAITLTGTLEAVGALAGGAIANVTAPADANMGAAAAGRRLLRK